MDRQTSSRSWMPVAWRRPLQGVGVATVAATLLPMLRHHAWWIRDLDFPRLQILALQAVSLAGLLRSGKKNSPADTMVLGLLAAAALFQARQIRPYTRLARLEVPDATSPRPASSLRLMVANVEMENRRTDRLLELIAEADPDIILAVETDRWWEERLRQLADAYPHRIFHPLDNTYGMLFFSRLELIESEILFLVKKEIPSIRARLRLLDGTEVILYGVHPEPPSPTERKSSTPRDAELLLVGERARREEGAVVVAGDLNDVAWSQTTRLFQKASGLLDPRVGRGRFSTFHARHPLFRWPLDHIFHSRHFALVELRVLPGFGSDHFPFLVTLHHQPQQKAAAPPPPDEEERAHMREKIAHARHAWPG